MVFQGRFKEHILPDQIHILNVAFLVPELRREFGGCAGNIAYNLKLLGDEPLIMATVGGDFGSYRAWLDSHRIDCRYIRELPDTLCAQAYITTDLDDNQITAFHPGAMNHAHLSQVPSGTGVKLGMISPDGREGMLEHAEQFHAAGVPFIFDPGQGLPMFGGDELRHFVKLASWVAVNDYESRVLSERTGWNEAELASHVDALIVTRGAEGSTIWSKGESISIPAVKPSALQDPTGCGDAYRAGVQFDLAPGLPWTETGRLAALLGSIKIAHRGTQNHHFTPTSLAQAFRAAFGHALSI